MMPMQPRRIFFEIGNVGFWCVFLTPPLLLLQPNVLQIWQGVVGIVDIIGYYYIFDATNGVIFYSTFVEYVGLDAKITELDILQVRTVTHNN